MNLKVIAVAVVVSLAAALNSATSSAAAPLLPNPIVSPADGLVSTVGYKLRRGLHRRHGIIYYNGHRGHRSYRSGYRLYRGHYFPRSAFSIHIRIAPRRHVAPRYIIRRAPARPKIISVGTAHVKWCFSKYRSYRASDNTFQPYHGNRKRCRSPHAR